MLRIAIPNKGALNEPAATLLKEAGYKSRSSSKELVLIDQENQVEFFFLRPRDIAVYVGTGTVDVGITGLDMLEDAKTKASIILELGFAKSKFLFAAPAEQQWDLAKLSGATIATSYEGLVLEYLKNNSLNAEVVHLDGAVESAIKLGIADVIADVVETGSTLKAAGLKTFGEPIMHSQAVLFARPKLALDANKQHALEVLVRRLKSVLVAQEYVLLDYDIELNLVDVAVGITPGFESPTISPLHGSNWCAVRAMVKRQGLNAIMDELYAAGARAIIVTEIQACRI